MFVSLVLAASVATAAPDPRLIPCSPGQTLTYRARVEWTMEDSDQTRTANIEWLSHVRQCNQGPNGSVVVFEGMPSDLAWYEPGKRPGLVAFLQNATGLYMRSLGGGELASGKNYPFADPDPTELVARFPLKDGDCAGGEDPERDDGMYCWSAHKNTDGSVTTGWTLTYASMGDHERMVIVPGVGITHFEYEHNGTVSAATADLIR